MSAPVVAFFNNKGGVGTTSLVYHLAWMLSDLGARVLVADLDPQADLTAALLEEEFLESLWREYGMTIFAFVDPVIQRGGGDISTEAMSIAPGLWLLPGDLRIARFEDILAASWQECRRGQAGGFEAVSAFSRMLADAAESLRADIVLVDPGPNLGVTTRCALLAADYLVVPLATDPLSLQGMKNLGQTASRWRAEWQQAKTLAPFPSDIPRGQIQPIGYVVQQHSVRLDRSAEYHKDWIKRVPEEFQESVLRVTALPEDLKPIGDDPWCLALIKHYHSLMPMAQEARKPMFHLKVADGAIGAHFQAAQEAGRQFRQLARRIAESVGVKLTLSSSSIHG